MRRAVVVALTTGTSLLGLTGAAAAIAVDMNVSNRVAPFVVPTAVDQGDEVVFDASAASVRPVASGTNYEWAFGDGNQATGPNVTHSYTTGGVYAVTLTVTDRRGEKFSRRQTVVVLGARGMSVPPATSRMSAATRQTAGSSGPATPAPASGGLQAQLQLLPEALDGVVRHGVAMRLTCDESADGYATVTVSRTEAKRLGLKLGRRTFSVIGQGTLSGIKNGTARLWLHLPRTITAKLAQLRRVTLSIRLVLIAPGGDHLALDATGRY